MKLTHPLILTTPNLENKSLRPSKRLLHPFKLAPDFRMHAPSMFSSGHLHRRWTHCESQGQFVFAVGMLEFHLGVLVYFRCPISSSLLRLMPKTAGRHPSGT